MLRRGATTREARDSLLPRNGVQRAARPRPANLPTCSSSGESFLRGFLTSFPRRPFRPRNEKPPRLRGFLNGRYWARTSDPQLVELGTLWPRVSIQQGLSPRPRLPHTPPHTLQRSRNPAAGPPVVAQAPRRTISVISNDTLHQAGDVSERSDLATSTGVIVRQDCVWGDEQTAGHRPGGSDIG